MGSSFATLVCVVGICGLFFIDRDKSLRTHKALWVPVIWLWIVGSRPVSAWLGLNPPAFDASSQGEGSPFDAAVFGFLLFIGAIVLIGRRWRAGAYLKASWPLMLYFAYCLLSILWSDFPDIAFKRWIKAIGDLVMALIVVTDADPIAAFKRMFSRVGFVLLPTSVLLIRYYDIGRGYDPDGRPMNTGVTTNKNLLGVITFVIALGALWHIVNMFRSKRQPNRARHVLAQGTLLAFGVVLLTMADSATSLACFMLGGLLVFATCLPVMKGRPRAVHALVLTIVLAGGLTFLLGGQAGVVHALGRNTTLTGRTEIWAAVLPVVPNRVIGAGFESFWLGPRLDMVYSRLSQYMHVNEAHNGYLEVYLNLGWIGVGLIAIIFINGYRAAVTAFRRNSEFGSLMVTYVAAAAIYSVSEAGFRMLDPIWIFLLLAVAGAHGVAAGFGIRSPHPVRAGADMLIATSHAAAVGVSE